MGNTFYFFAEFGVTMANFCATFSSINEAFDVVQKYLADNVFVYYPPVSWKCDSVDQSTACMCSSYLPAPFQASQLSLKIADLTLVRHYIN